MIMVGLSQTLTDERMSMVQVGLPSGSTLQGAFLATPINVLHAFNVAGGWEPAQLLSVFREAPSGGPNGFVSDEKADESPLTPPGGLEDKVDAAGGAGHGNRRKGRGKKYNNETGSSRTNASAGGSVVAGSGEATAVSYVIPHRYIDPLAGLSHPAVAGLVIERLGSLGFSLLYGITGQVADERGDGIDEYEENAFDAALELLLCVVAPRLPAVHKQLCMEKIAILEESVRSHRQRQNSEGHKQKARRRGKGKGAERQRKGSRIGKDDPAGGGASVPPPNEALADTVVEGGVGLECRSSPIAKAAVRLSDMFDYLYAHKVYQSSLGPVSVRDAIQSGVMLYPGEDPSSRRLRMSLLRSVTSTLSNEIMGLWFDIDQMLSLLGGAVDDACRLVTVLRGFYVWLVVDEWTVPAPVSADVKRRHGRSTGSSPPRALCETWQLGALAEAVSAPPVVSRRQTYSAGGVDTALQCVSSGFAPTPSAFLYLCHNRTDGLRALVDSTSEDAEEELLNSHLLFLLRTPWVLEDLQRLDYVVNAMDTEANEDHENSLARDDYEIYLNRFTEPPVWCESVLQQLIICPNRSLHKSNLSIQYQGEAGIGPGPLKEFLEMCRIFFSSTGISSSSLTDMIVVPPSASSTPGAMLDAPAETSDAPSREGDGEGGVQEQQAAQSAGALGSGRPVSRRSNFADVTLISLFPLFRPAGESFPTCVVPLELTEIAQRVHSFGAGGEVTDTAAAGEATEGATGSEEIGGEEGPAFGKTGRGAGKGRNRWNQSGRGKTGGGRKHTDRSHKQAMRVARLMFECVGILLGFSIVNCCPIGVGLPAFIWTLLLKQEVKDDGSVVRRRHRDLVTWQELCGEDVAMVRSCSTILNDLTEQQLQDMDMSFTGMRYRWNHTTRSLRLEEVELLPGGGSMGVAIKNKEKYVNLYVRARFLSAGMEDSVEAMRKGLLRVIPQHLLNILSLRHIQHYIQGDDVVDVQSLRCHVLYSHGFSASHRVIKLFWHLLEHELSEGEKRNLLLFWTGNSVPPHGGFGGDGGSYEEVQWCDCPACGVCRMVCT